MTTSESKGRFFFTKRIDSHNESNSELECSSCYQFRCLVNRGTMGVNSFPKTVTRQRRGCNLNPGPSAPESSTLTTRLQSHPLNKWRRLTSSQLHLYSATDRGTRNIVMSVSVCPRSYLRNDISDLHEIFCPLPVAVARSSTA